MNRNQLFTSKFSMDFDAIYKHIQHNSPQNAKKFAKELDLKIEKIKEQPAAFSLEPSIPTKQNWYRFAILMKRWKIIFKVTNELLVFLGIIHTSRHLRQIKKLRTNKYQ